MKTAIPMILLVMAVGGGLGGLLMRCINGDEIYNDMIDQKHVLYQEGRYGGANNRMVVKDGDTLYDLYDIAEETKINDNKIDNEQLEIIVIKDKTGKRKYGVSDINEDTLSGKHAKPVFEECNRMYNRFRGNIRDNITKQYKTIEDRIPQ